MKHFILTLIIITLLPSLGFAKRVSLESRYICENQDPFKGKTYQGTLVVQKTGETAYRFAWDYGNDQQYKGTGLFNFRNNAIGVVFTDIVKPNHPHKIIGLHTYRLNPSGNILKGPWILQDANRPGYETCRKTR